MLPKDAKYPEDLNMQRETTVVEKSFNDLSCGEKFMQ